MCAICKQIKQLFYLTFLAIKLVYHRDRMQNLIRDTL